MPSGAEGARVRVRERGDAVSRWQEGLPWLSMIGTPCCQHKGHGFDPWSGN